MDLREAVLDASVELIAEKGIGALSMREVARRLGVTHGAPYHHFKSRAEILAAVTEEGFRRLTLAMRSAVQNPAIVEPRQRFAACGIAYVRFAVETSALFRIMFRPELAGRKKHRSIEDAAQGAFDVLVECVRECQASGLARDVDPLALTLTGWSTAHGLAALCIDGPLKSGMKGVGASPAMLAEVVGATLGRLLVTAAPARLKRHRT